ncbi:hypothetical protein SMICM17S_12480 [Streptomyces microflavus]
MEQGGAAQPAQQPRRLREAHPVHLLAPGQQVQVAGGAQGGVDEPGAGFRAVGGAGHAEGGEGDAARPVNRSAEGAGEAVDIARSHSSRPCSARPRRVRTRAVPGSPSKRPPASAGSRRSAAAASQSVHSPGTGAPVRCRAYRTPAAPLARSVPPVAKRPGPPGKRRSVRSGVAPAWIPASRRRCRPGSAGSGRAAARPGWWRRADPVRHEVVLGQPDRVEPGLLRRLRGPDGPVQGLARPLARELSCQNERSDAHRVLPPCGRRVSPPLATTSDTCQRHGPGRNCCDFPLTHSRARSRRRPHPAPAPCGRL